MRAGARKKCARLLLADDHRLVLEGLQRVLEPEFDVIGAVEDGRALVRAAKQLEPDAILLDISMPFLNGIDAARQLRQCCPRTKLIIVSMHTERPFVIGAFRAGASGYVLKHSTPNEMLAAVRHVLAGGYYLPPGIATEVQQEALHAAQTQPPGQTQPRLGELTPRQREVLQLAAEGRSNKEIAAILNLSVKAVEFHKTCIFRVTGARNSAELTRYAVEHGLIQS